MTDDPDTMDESEDVESFEDEPDEDVIPEALEEDLEVDGDGIEAFDDDDAPEAIVIDDDDDDDEDEDAPRPRARKVASDDDDDDDEDQDPDDVEADLDAILRDRMASTDDDDDDEDADEEGTPTKTSAAPGKGNEIVCQSCFLLVNRNQLRGPEPRCLHCGELIEV